MKKYQAADIWSFGLNFCIFINNSSQEMLVPPELSEEKLGKSSIT
jgi:hypothetical protein